MNSFWQHSRQLWSDTYMFIRLAAFGFTGILPFLGVISVQSTLTYSQSLGLFAVAFFYHNYTYVLNDLIDLPLDRTEPLRAHYPLVRGSVQPKYALIFVCLQLPALFVVAGWLGAEGKAFLALCISLSLITLYNVGSKYTPFPLAMDALQGMAWGSLVLFGAFVCARQASGLTWILFFIITVYILLVNGVHGSLRDLENDLRSGAKTTALVLGARPRQKGAIVLSPPLISYMLLLQFVLGGLTVFPVLQNWFGYDDWELRIVLVVIAAILSGCLFLTLLVVRLQENRWDMFLAGSFHLLISMGLLLAPFIFYTSWAMLILVLVIYAVPVLTMWLHRGFEWG